jgi:hypothetical protein
MNEQKNELEKIETDRLLAILQSRNNEIKIINDEIQRRINLQFQPMTTNTSLKDEKVEKVEPKVEEKKEDKK